MKQLFNIFKFKKKMNNNLKICFNIYITMSSIDKSIVSILEGDIESMDYGVPEFNRIFKSLDMATKKRLLKEHPDNKDIHIGIMKNIKDQEIQELWDSLSEEEKEKIDDKGIWIRYQRL